MDSSSAVVGAGERFGVVDVFGIRGFILASCALLPLTGCGSGPTRPAQRPNDIARPADPARLGTLDVVWWMLPPAPASTPTADNPARLDLVLAKYQSNDTGLSDEQLIAWRDNGLRVLAVPTSEIESIRKALNASGPIEHQVLAQSGTWKAAYKGPSWTGPATLQLDNGPLELPAGALRAMVRSWLVPMQASASAPDSLSPRLSSASSAAMQIELALQHLESRKRVSEFQAALAIDVPKTLNDEGLVFWRLALSGTLRAGQSYLIVPVEPGAEWKAGILDRLAEQGAAKVADGAPGAPTGIAGPALPAPPSLGEALLSDAVRGRSDRRFILVLTPNVPERFELLPGGVGP